jgi:hypothetical protein
MPELVEKDDDREDEKERNDVNQQRTERAES